MKKVLVVIFVLALLSAFFVFKNKKDKIVVINNEISSKNEDLQKIEMAAADEYQEKRNEIISKFKDIKPEQWSEQVNGVKTSLNTNAKVIALTFDACGGDGKNGYDQKLIDYLEKEKIPATLFVGGKWIENNSQNFEKIAANKFFEIENHGYLHVPCSVSGKSAYGIIGERNVGEVVDEIEQNARKIQTLIGRKPIFYRAGTAFTDDICPQIASMLNEEVVNYNVLGDAGATYSANQIVDSLSRAKNGSIALLHMNHPEKETAEGIMRAVPVLRALGFSFVKLEDYQLK
ncbi:MAG: polysaccharide deacetylase family protein [bacterium]